MPFPFGVWKIDANGFVGQMEIDGIDSAGNIAGTVTIDAGQKDGLAGFWNEASQAIIFQRLTNNGDPASVQVYKGYLFRDPLNTNADNPFSLAGHFETFSGNAGGTAQKSMHGWYAQWTAPPPPPATTGPAGGGGGGSAGGEGPGGRGHPHPEE